MAVASLSSPLVSVEEVSQMLGVTVGTLAVWRCTRRYDIPYVKVGKCVKYRVSDLERFVASRTIGATVTADSL